MTIKHRGEHPATERPYHNHAPTRSSPAHKLPQRSQPEQQPCKHNLPQPVQRTPPVQRTRAPLTTQSSTSSPCKDTRRRRTSAGPSQSLIRPVAQATSTSTSDAACPADVSSAPAVSLDMSVLSSEIVRAVVSEMRMVMDEHYSNIKTELLDMKSELLRDFAVLRSDFAGLKSTVSYIERSQALQAKVESLSKEISRLDAKCDDLESRSRRQNICIVGIPEGESFTLTTSSVSELLKKAFALDKPPLVDRAHRTLAPKPMSGDPQRPVIARLHYYEHHDFTCPVEAGRFVATLTK
ncbi:hypothetical protein MHYP_G00087040 [Metynnis hypsauchen]